MIIEIISMAMIAAGLIFFASTAMGLMRFPDFYTRIHAAGKGDTLSSLLIVLGLAIYNLNHFSGAALLVSIKMGLICAFIFISSPTTTHVLMEAGYDIGVKHWTREDEEEQEQEDQEEEAS